MSKVVRPTWSEIEAMDWPMAAAVIDNLPPLVDGGASDLVGVMAQVFGAKRR